MIPAPLSAPYLDGLARGELRYQVCLACEAPQTLARYACRNCGSTRLEWHRAAGRGIVYAVTVVARAPSEEFRALAPYTIAIVELDEGPRVMGHAVAGATIGDRVVAEYVAFAGRNLVRFRPKSSPPTA
jgi:uncharacterized OB-fold protein